MTTFYVDLENGSDSTGTALVDASNNAFTLTLANSADITARASKFGTTALDCTDTTSSINNAQVAAPGTALQIGTGQFCFEGWFWLDPNATFNNPTYVFGLGTSTASGISYYLSRSGGTTASGSWLWNYSTTGTSATGTGAAGGTIPTSTWIHLCVERDSSNTLRIYQNGVVMFTATNHTISYYASTSPFAIGSLNSATATWRGCISEFRATIGASRYGGAFTPPATAFPIGSGNDSLWSNVALLVHFDGNARTGLSYASRLKTLAAVTGAKATAGDTVRIMASQDPTLIGNVTWTQYSKIITLASAVTANIDLCEVAWTPVAPVTSGVSGTNKQGTNSAVITSNSFTTGKMAYKALGAVTDLSAYQQVSFWFRSNTAQASSILQFCLCSDTTGDVPVVTFNIPACVGGSQFFPVTFDNGAALPTNVQSIAIYATSTPGTAQYTIDNILACKASSSPDSLTLTSLIGKVYNLSWSASTAYNLNDRRRPTQPNRNGFQYQVTTAGTTGSTEPTWPAYWGGTVTDGTVVWTCIQDELEDTWWGIQSINGATVILDVNVNATPSSTNRGYHGATETVATYKRETIKTAMVSSLTTAINSSKVAGTSSSPVTYSGGWSRTDMSTQTGETWLDAQNGLGTMFNWTHTFNVLANLNSVRAGYLVNPNTSGMYMTLRQAHACNGGGLINGTSLPLVMKVYGAISAAHSTTGQAYNNAWALTASALGAYSNASSGIVGASTGYLNVNAVNLVARNNQSYGYSGFNDVGTISNLVTVGNIAGGVSLNTETQIALVNPSISEGFPIQANTTLTDRYTYIQKYQRTTDSHLIYTDGGTIVSATDQRHTASGISWKFRPTSTTRGSNYPLKLSIYKYACATNTQATISVWVYRDNANIQGQISIAGGQVAGIPTDLAINCQPTINTWTQYSLPFTATENGVVEILFKVWDGVGTTNNLWIDDVSVV